MKIFLQIIQIAILSMFFNGEYLAYGPFLFLNGGLILFYLIFAASLYFLKEKLNLSFKILSIIGIIIGLTLETFITKSVFFPLPFTVGGLNPLAIFQQTIAWGFLATFMPLYLSDRLKNKQKIDNFILAIIFSYLIFQFFIKTFFPPAVDMSYFFSVIVVFLLLIGRIRKW